MNAHILAQVGVEPKQHSLFFFLGLGRGDFLDLFRSRGDLVCHEG